MPATLISLYVSQGLIVNERTDGPVTQSSQLSNKSLRADLLLHLPEGDPDQADLGDVRLTIEANPRSVAPMTPDATLRWLQEVLKRML